MDQTTLMTALQNFAEGRQSDVDHVIRQLQSPCCKDQHMADVLNLLKNCVSMLVREKFEVVVGALLVIDWTNRSAGVVKAYHTFIVNLVSAHSVYTPSVIRSLVALFIPKPREVCAKEVLLLGQLEEERRRVLETEMANVHVVIRSVLKAVPTCTHTLSKSIVETCPYFLDKNSSKLETYLQNLLHLTTYCSSLRSTVLGLMVEKMIQLDVRASREKIEDAESDSEDEEDGEIFQMETDDIAEVKAQNKVEEADRLDALMFIAFNYIDKTCRDADAGTGDKLNWEATKKLYLELLTLFEKTVLPTHECCHTQFLFFYICSLRQNLADGFMDYLWKKVKDPNAYPIYRKSAICYLASFVARAQFVSIRSAADAVSLLCEWIHRYISAAQHNSMHNDITHHGTFYSVVQAVMYILAFRQREFLEMEKVESFFVGLSLQCIVTCKLNPLRVCQPVVARTFSAFVRKHQLAFCDAIIERNNRLLVPTMDETGMASQHLESYFPFDPYLLSRSSAKISDLYRTFEGNAIVDIPSLYHQGQEDEFVEEGIAHAKSPVDAETFLTCISPGFNVT